jgi:nicotinate-nucleotide pyrophosphorylase (carboxylating)
MLAFPICDDVLINALKEDIGTGDITTLSTIPPDAMTTGRFIAKEPGVICGMPVVKRVFELIDPLIEIDVYINDGEFAQKGSAIASIRGSARSVLVGERTALNLLQMLSGVATKTRQCVDAVKGTKAVIADTRKTTPGLRTLEKYAVRVGGGSNHRFNLSDGVLIKDNHIRAAGGITAAVGAARKGIPHTLKIEVEVENIEMVEEALACGADIIMLDNMTTREMEAAVKLINGRALVEASGNMGKRDLASVAKTGVDIISVGALTHSITAMDISQIVPIQ